MINNITTEASKSFTSHILNGIYLYIFFFKTFEDEEILRCLKEGKHGKEYSPKLRSFAFTLHFYSPKAYNYLRSVFGEHLPCTSTLRNWYRAVDGSPGISSDAMNALKLKATSVNANGKTILVALILDEVSIRQGIQ